MSAQPLVSICIPTYNRPAALARVVEGILAQTYRPIEIIVTDDGSAEATRAHLAPFFDRIRYEPNERRLGIYGNWNRSISFARGELVGVYHDHDDYAPTIVERSVELFQRSPRVGIVHAGASLLQPDGSVVSAVHHDLPVIADGRWFARRQAWRWSSYVAHGAMIVKKDLYQRFGSFDERAGIAADMDMLIRYSLECDIGYIHEPLYGYSGRRPEDPLFDFDWSHLVAYLAVRRTNFRRVYDGDRRRLGVALTALQLQFDERALRQLLVGAVHGRARVVEEGLGVIDRFASPPARAVARVIAQDGPLARSVRSRSYRAYKWAQRARRSLGAADGASGAA